MKVPKEGDGRTCRSMSAMTAWGQEVWRGILMCFKTNLAVSVSWFWSMVGVNQV
jgi:hypothetical protein